MTSMLSSLLAPPVIHKVTGARTVLNGDAPQGVGKRSNVYGRAKLLTLEGLRKFGPISADSLAEEAFLNPYTVRKVLNALLADGTAKIVRPASSGARRTAAIWKAI